MKSYLPIVVIILCLIGCKPKQKENSISFGTVLNEISPKLRTENYNDLTKFVIGSEIENHVFTDIDGNKIALAEIDKPIFLEATASWCKPCIALIPSLNKLAEKYSDRVEFILLTHDTSERAKKLRAKLHPNIKVIPSIEEADPTSNNKLKVGSFQQVFPFPTSYFINKDKKISDIKIGATVYSIKSAISKEDTDKFNYSALEKSLKKIIK